MATTMGHSRLSSSAENAGKLFGSKTDRSNNHHAKSTVSGADKTIGRKADSGDAPSEQNIGGGCRWEGFWWQEN